MDLQRRLLSGLFWVLLLNLLIKPLWILGIDLGVQNAVGFETYGLYFAIFNVSYIFNILLDMGVTNFNTRNIAQHPQLIRKHLSHILTLKVALLGLYLMVTFSVGLLRGYGSREFLLLAWLCLNQFLSSLILYLRSNFQGLLLFKWDSVLSVLDRMLMIVICGALLLGCEHFEIEWFVLAQTAAYLLTALTAFTVIARRTGLKGLHWNKAFSWVILRRSFPFALLVLIMASYNRIDPILLEWLLPDGKYQAGVYAGAFRLLDALTMIAYMVSVPLLPIYSKLTAGKVDREQIARITKMVFSMMMVFAIAAAVTFSFMAESLMDLLYKDYSLDLVATFRLLIFGIIPISFTYVFGTLLTANGSLRQLNIFAAIALLLNVAVNLLLIPKMYAVGSAFASLTAQSFMALAQLALACRLFGLRPNMRYVAQLIGYLCVIVLSNVACHSLKLAWWWHLMVLIVVALAAALALRLVDVGEIRSIVRNKD